jgi:hypothetical protein
MTVPAHLRKRKPIELPPPPTFSLAALAEDAHLTQKEVASVLRKSLSWVEKGRLDGFDQLEWTYVEGRPRCLAGSLKRKVAGSPDRAPQLERLRPKQAAPSPKAKPKKRASVEARA